MMIPLLGPVSVPHDAANGDPWPVLILLAVFVAAMALVVAWDVVPWTRKPAQKEEPVRTYPKAA